MGDGDKQQTTAAYRYAEVAWAFAHFGLTGADSVCDVCDQESGNCDLHQR